MTQVRTESGDDLPPSSPRYLIIPAGTSRSGDKYFTDQICIIDFGESFSVPAPPEDLGIPENYLPPEVLLDQENLIGPACDLWALGCTPFEIRKQLPLFYMIFDRDELLTEIVRFFGKPPQALWDEWESRGDYFDDKGAWLGERCGEDWSLEAALSAPMEIIRGGSDDEGATPKTLVTSKPEQEQMADLLSKLFRWEAAQRPSAEEVLRHEWFKM